MQKLQRWLWRIAKLLAVAAAVGGLVYWLKFSPVPVREHRIETGEIVAEVMGTGTLEARVKSTVSPKIAGRIEQLLADQGDHVQAGQLLFTLDDAELKQQVEIAQADIASAQAALDRLEADRAQAAAILEQARQSDERVKKLVAREVATAEESDKATEALSVAQAGVARAEAALLEGRKQLIAAEKNLDFRRAVLADTQVSAPFDGLIVRRYRDPGDIVVPGSPALTLVSLDEIWISAWVDETEMARLRADQPARVVFRSEPRGGYQGRVARLGREADRETREFVVDVRVLKLPENWAVGQRAEVYIETDRKPAIPILPTSFVIWRDEKAGVFCKVGGRAQWRPVELGLQARETAEVVAGLQAGDVVLQALGSKSPALEGRRVVAP
ncbi:MAG: efflux RND transporter periplasmic adaptor subunit [Pirellulaceae bacterium]|nr:efflux RND transporter periplasmic adaptor subunit [Pirellulaceae bacterium]